MRPRERQETGEQDLFRSRLDRIIDLTHALVKLSRAIDWRFLEAQFGSVYSDGPGCPPLPTQLMAGLALLKHMYDLSDEVLCDRWIENPYFQFFCGEEFFQHRLPFDRSSLTRWRQRMGDAKLTALLQESLSVATRTEAMKPKDLAQSVPAKCWPMSSHPARSQWCASPKYSGRRRKARSSSMPTASIKVSCPIFAKSMSKTALPKVASGASAPTRAATMNLRPS